MGGMGRERMISRYAHHILQGRFDDCAVLSGHEISWAS
jgi:hypothetical protein